MNRWLLIFLIVAGSVAFSSAHADPNSLLPRPPRPPAKASGEPIQPTASEIKPGSLSPNTVTPNPELKPVEVQPGRLETQNLSNTGTAQPAGVSSTTNSIWQPAPSAAVAPAVAAPNLWTTPARPNPWTTSAPAPANPWQSDNRTPPDWWKPPPPAHTWPERTPQAPTK
ncbi:MAG: hypothetical protein RMM51_00750 [Verrucomicrobiae bacterium]|nr:hypothetical protein [Verrucomicrobiae bacterium]